MKHIFLICILFLLMHPVSALSAETWGVYWYLCGSDLETLGGAASADLEELLKTRLPDNVVVVIQTGGARRWHHSGISSQHIGRYVYRDGELEQSGRLPQANMGDGETLASFLAFCKENYPADHQVFVFWNHGGGSIGGVANDENFNNDALSLKEIRQAFEKIYTPSSAKPPFELIGFDTCLMATLDTANTLSGLAQYMVASQELEPGNGWEYTGWVGALGANPSMNGAALGKIICDTYMEGCRREGTEGSATLSLVDLGKLPVLNMTYNALGLEAVVKVMENESFYAAYGRQAKSAENYMNSRTEGFTNMVDIGSLVRNLKWELPEFTQLMLDALDEAVIYKVSGPYRNPSGISCYYPFDGNSDGFKAMMDTGNVTSFLILNGLQLGFFDTDKAIAYLERISDEISAALEADEEGSEDNGPATPPSPSQSSETLPQYDYSALAGILSGLSSSGTTTPADIAVLIGQASSTALTSIESLRKLDISSLEDFEVTITDEGNARLALGPERIRFLDSVCFYLAYYSLEDDLILLLGKDSDMDADWDTGIFQDNFQGVWAAFDGHLVYLDIVNESDRFNHYAVPIKLNGVLCNLVVVYDFDKEGYRILGARRILENNIADKALIQLKPGDNVTTVLKAMSISGDDDEFQDVEVDEFTLGEHSVFEDINMGDGTFMFMFEMTDVQNNSATSQAVTIEVKDGEIFLSDIE